MGKYIAALRNPHSRAVWWLAAIGKVWEGLGRFGSIWDFNIAALDSAAFAGCTVSIPSSVNYRYPPLFTVQHNGTVQKNKRKEGWGLWRHCKYGKCWKLQEAACKVTA